MPNPKFISENLRYVPPPGGMPGAAGEEPIRPEKRGFSLVRPFRYAYLFTTGTVIGALDSMARWTRRGAFIGVVGAVVAAYAPASLPVAVAGIFAGYSGLLPMLAIGFVTGCIAGAMLGTAIGAVTGGFEQVSKCMNREYVADAMARRQEPPKPVVRGPSTADILKAQRQKAIKEYAQMRELQNELQRDGHEHRDRELARRAHGHAAGVHHWF